MHIQVYHRLWSDGQQEESSQNGVTSDRWIVAIYPHMLGMIIIHELAIQLLKRWTMINQPV